MAYIAEQYTFKRQLDLDKLNIERERNKMVDVLLRFLEMSWAVIAWHCVLKQNIY